MVTLLSHCQRRYACIIFIPFDENYIAHFILTLSDVDAWYYSHHRRRRITES